MPGPAKKPNRQRRNHDTQATQQPVDLRLVKGGALDPGELSSREFLKVTRDWWVDFWRQRELLLGLGDIDVHLVRRLATLHDLRERAYRKTKKAMLVIGSKGQPVENPAAKAMREYDKEIRQIEDRLGLNPRGRLNLGIQFGQARKSIEDLIGDTEDDADDEDNRPQIVDV